MTVDRRRLRRKRGLRRQGRAGEASTSTLLVVEPALPAYRLPMWEQLHSRLAANGVQLVLAVPEVGETLSRGDSRPFIHAIELPATSVRLPGRSVSHLRVHDTLHALRPDLIIVEQAIKRLESYEVLIRSAALRTTGRQAPSIAMLGHGRSYSTPQGPVAAALKQFLTHRGQWFFAYTQAGSDYVVSHGFPRTRVSVLNNTIDTDALAAALSLITNDDVAAFRRRHALTRERTALFLGGVDQAKGIDLLLESAQEAEHLLPGFVLLVGGAGHDLPKVQAAQAAGAPVRALGRLDGAEKALALRAADVLAIPEWIGLVAVDSLVAGRPIVSTWHPSHSPEYEYLVPDTTAVFVDHEARTFARAMTHLLDSGERLAAMQARCLEDSASYGLDEMVDNFVEGVLAWDDVRRSGL